VSAFERAISRCQWNSLPSRVVASTGRLLERLADHQVCGTFFVLGWVAARFPAFVREIQAAGHEIGSHGYWHRLIYSQTPVEFRSDVRQSKQVIEDAIGQPVTAYRAPSFSITLSSLWAPQILVEEGFRVDSSVFPTRHDRYGIPGAKATIHTLHTPSGPLVEFPPTIARFGRFAAPVGGGGYFRLYPYALTRTLLRRIERSEQRPFMFYIHPWEIDPQQPRLRAGSRLSRLRHYINLPATERKLGQLLRDFAFGPMSTVLAGEQSKRLPLAGVAA
jgi:polysaccharide deacetylase family protein (PEP-CTERM system associated)